MRGKKRDVCHTCRQHKIGCDGLKPFCSQCRLTDRVCQGYVQDLVVFHHTPATRRRPHPGKKKVLGPESLEKASDKDQREHAPAIDHSRTAPSCVQRQPTWEECVGFLVQHYIPKDEIPFVTNLEPSRSRICGGWVQALPHVSKDHKDFERIVSPAVRALTMSMMVTDKIRRQEYLDTYGAALQGIREVLYMPMATVESTVAIASMCLALSEDLVPTSDDGYHTHLRGVAAMVQSQSPDAFVDGVAHLMFVGVRPLIILDAILRRKGTFLLKEKWQTIPFSLHPATHMQMLLGYAAAIPPLLEGLENKHVDSDSFRDSLRDVLGRLEEWQAGFEREGMLPKPIGSHHLDLSTDPHILPDVCFDFVDVSHANSLTHCWALRVLCLLQLIRLDVLRDGSQSTEQQAESLCMLICRGLPYLLQKKMKFYGSMSASFPLHMVSESLKVLPLNDPSLNNWTTAIKEQLHSQRITLYEDMSYGGFSI